MGELSTSRSGGEAITPRRSHKRTTINDAKRWAAMYQNRMSMLKIGREEGVDPGTISDWLRKLGIEVRQGEHFVDQPPLKLPRGLIELCVGGSESVRRYLERKVWGIKFSRDGLEQLGKFCKFLGMHKANWGVLHISRELGIHRSTVLEWRSGTDSPYLVRIANDVLRMKIDPGWMALPLRLESGGNVPKDWIVVPDRIRNYDDVAKVVSQLRALEGTTDRANLFGIPAPKLNDMKMELFAYLLGIMLGDSGKLHSEQTRFLSMNLDLQLTMKHCSNERMGEFTCLASNVLGISMKRIADKHPTGADRTGRNPSDNYRWTSVRSPLLAWMFTVGLGLSPGKTTTTHPVDMEWIRATPRLFRIRFVQGVGDSDGCVKVSEVEITSLPNADFVTRLLKELGLRTARTTYEKGDERGTMVYWHEALSLPIFSEFVRSYRFEKLMAYGDRRPRHWRKWDCR